MTTCVLSPFGTHATNDACVEESACGYKWMCDDEGIPVLAQDGLVASEADCKCWECLPGTPDDGPICSVRTDGLGVHTTAEECDCKAGFECTPNGPVWSLAGTKALADDCKYVCDGEGGVKEDTNGDGLIYSDVKCYTCDGTSEPTEVVTGELGAWDSADECHYWCEDGVAQAVPKGTAGIEALPSTSAVVKCYTCNGTSNPTEVVNGELGAWDSTDACHYWCEDGVAAAAPLGTTNIEALPSTSADVKCYTCDGDPGPDSMCGLVANEKVGSYITSAECELDSVAQCGWKYDCLVDAKYACIDGLSVAAVPKAQCDTNTDLTCYDTVMEVVNATGNTCNQTVGLCDETNQLSGNWLLHRSAEYNPIFGEAGGNRVLTFTSDHVDSDGFHWHVSNETDNEVNPRHVLEIGLREELTIDARKISIKFRGRMLWTDVTFADTEYFDFWSENSTSISTSSYDSPDEIPLATIPWSESEEYSCYALESIDLGLLPDGSVVRGLLDGTTEEVFPMLLQREDMCPDSRVLGMGDANGRLAGTPCPTAVVRSGGVGKITADTCTNLMAPMDGEWMLHRGPGFIPMHNGDYMSFKKSERGTDPLYTWYESTETTDDGVLPLLEIGFRETEGSDPSKVRFMYLKFKGRVKLDVDSTEDYVEYFADSEAHLIALLDLANGTNFCWRMESISLGYYFDDADFDSIILQRKELCPDGRWISDPNAAISRSLVEGECTSLPEFGVYARNFAINKWYPDNEEWRALEDNSLSGKIVGSNDECFDICRDYDQCVGVAVEDGGDTMYCWLSDSLDESPDDYIISSLTTYKRSELGDVNVVADIDPADCPTPMDGEWLMHRSVDNIPMFELENNDFTEIVTFSYNMTDTSGYVWYDSSAKDDLGGPSLEIGFKYEDAANGMRDISMKFRGRTEWGTSYQNYWSSSGNSGIDQVGSFDSPVAIIIATIPVGTCFSMESADLAKICGGDHFCATRLESTTNKQIGTFILQRHDLCNGEHWVGAGGTLGYLDPAKCP